MDGTSPAGMRTTTKAIACLIGSGVLVLAIHLLGGPIVVPRGVHVCTAAHYRRIDNTDNVICTGDDDTLMDLKDAQLQFYAPGVYDPHAGDSVPPSFLVRDVTIAIQGKDAHHDHPGRSINLHFHLTMVSQSYYI